MYIFFLPTLFLDFMEQDVNGNEPFSVLQSRLLYRSCMATGKYVLIFCNNILLYIFNSCVDEIDMAGLKPLLELLDQIGLPYLEFTTKNSRRKHLSLSQLLAGVHKYLSLEYLFAITVEPNPKNRTVNRISLSKPTGSIMFPA